MSSMPEPKALSVSEFIRVVNVIFEDKAFPEGVLIEGEVSQYKVSQGKWIWFDLKDGESVINCFSNVWQLKTPLEDGMQVRIHGAPTVFGKSGKFTVKVDRAEPVGEGALKRAYELLKKKLEAEGLFDQARKRTIPRFPERIGIIASTESAAYGDFLRMLGNRWGGVKITAAHVQVQGRDAVSDIVNAFRYFNTHPELAEVLVLTRGGGSLEDLHAFNSEEVARAVFSSKIPVICAVGHERDESLADFAADIRASTPSNAAERIAPDRRDVAREVDAMTDAMASALEGVVHAKERRLFELETRLTSHVREAREDFEAVMSDLDRALAGFEQHVIAKQGYVAAHERLLKTLDPQAVLRRGYAIARGSDGRILRDAEAIDKGARINVQLAKGDFDASRL